jgi:mannose-6-phosphate isomerase
MKVRWSDTPWGCELLLARTDRYASKILCIRAGERLSLQHHDCKDETLLLLEGHAEISIALGPSRSLRQRMPTHRSYHVLPGQKHRVTAITDARILEVSTPELDDVVRWRDDYGRASAPRSRGRTGPDGSTGDTPAGRGPGESGAAREDLR